MEKVRTLHTHGRHHSTHPPHLTLPHPSPTPNLLTFPSRIPLSLPSPTPILFSHPPSLPPSPNSLPTSPFPSRTPLFLPSSPFPFPHPPSLTPSPVPDSHSPFPSPSLPPFPFPIPHPFPVSPFPLTRLPLSLSSPPIASPHPPFLLAILLSILLFRLMAEQGWQRTLSPPTRSNTLSWGLNPPLVPAFLPLHPLSINPLSQQCHEQGWHGTGPPFSPLSPSTRSAGSEDDDGTSERPTELADAYAVNEDDDGTGELAHAQSAVNENDDGTVSSPMRSECMSS
ncbi:unnamed protein product [Closterium sp. Naga37s-1]|nr:unnamed protein product [Closterium sp. Naga37s-1]